MKLNELKQKNIKTKATSPLFKMESKQNANKLFAFAILTALLVLVAVPFYNYLQSAGVQYSFADFNEYFSVQALLTWGLLNIVYASYLGTRIITSDFKKGSSTMLYSLNFSRNKILNHKLLRLVINIVVLNLSVAIVGGLAIVLFEGGLSIANFAVMTMVFVIVGLQAGALAFSLTLLNYKKGSVALSVTAAIVLVVISSISSLATGLESLSYVSPLVALLNGGSFNVMAHGLEAVNLAALAVWTFIPLFVLPFGYMRFNKSDLA